DINNQFSRNYELEATFPRIRLRTAGPLITAVYRKFFKVYNDNMEAYARIASSEEPRYIAGLYRTRRDDEEARSDFVFGLDLSDANKAVLSEIEASECAVAVHVRRGDYAGFAFEVTDSNYFKESIALTADRAAPRTPIFFVFSDGMDWCRKNFTGISENLVFAENNDNDHGPADMYLMSRCHHFILSRSTFSYWSAFLSTRAPDKMMIWPGKRS
ncbi:MAG: alpha-1,2-fucosyltransferase, partial [Synergistaceae bacterium]|nr:alpha-1,2-fucosyltransferase [Synergistaceae bacterium]